MMQWRPTNAVCSKKLRVVAPSQHKHLTAVRRLLRSLHDGQPQRRPHHPHRHHRHHDHRPHHDPEGHRLCPMSADRQHFRLPPHRARRFCHLPVCPLTHVLLSELGLGRVPTSFTVSACHLHCRLVWCLGPASAWATMAPAASLLAPASTTVRLVVLPSQRWTRKSARDANTSTLTLTQWPAADDGCTLLVLFAPTVLRSSNQQDRQCPFRLVCAGQIFGWEAIISFILVSVVYAVAIGSPSFGAHLLLCAVCWQRHTWIIVTCAACRTPARSVCWPMYQWYRHLQNQ